MPAFKGPGCIGHTHPLREHTTHSPGSDQKTCPCSSWELRRLPPQGVCWPEPPPCQVPLGSRTRERLVPGNSWKDR